MQPNKIGHLTPKPQPLMEMLVSKCPDGVVVTCSWQRTTPMAERRLQAIGVEIEEEYCELIASRPAQGVLFKEAAAGLSAPCCRGRCSRCRSAGRADHFNMAKSKYRGQYWTADLAPCRYAIMHRESGGRTRPRTAAAAPAGLINS